MPKTMLAYLILLIITFLLGSIPWGIIISRLFYNTDIRKHGSGNIGTTNAMRALGKVGGSVVFVLDFTKGLLSGFGAVIAISVLWPGQPAVPILESVHTGTGAGIASLDANALRCVSLAGCVLGHIFSPWLGFRGGKGIAVAVGCVFITLGPLGAAIEIAVFIVVVALSRYISLGSIAAAIAYPICALWFMQGSWLAFGLCLVIGAVVVWAHRDNIKRLLNHSENRIGSKKSKTGESLKSGNPLKAGESLKAGEPLASGESLKAGESLLNKNNNNYVENKTDFNISSSDSNLGNNAALVNRASDSYTNGEVQ
ncbi:MAG: glycerol-3-phosphate 1-O-acyltransferase PlsY [Coriobacteriales bacterium]|jgi:glycerol-3-phosphate acyltransferase PlsY|nr:glycerol-3-phosphate 1-O-acyltransferase PlsY [Coriobacteriales bacterium]